MSNNSLKEMSQGNSGIKILLWALEEIAQKNAHTLCRGVLYEPEVPEKLKK